MSSHHVVKTHGVPPKHRLGRQLWAIGCSVEAQHAALAFDDIADARAHLHGLRLELPLALIAGAPPASVARVGALWILEVLPLLEGQLSTASTWSSSRRGTLVDAVLIRRAMACFAAPPGVSRDVAGRIAEQLVGLLRAPGSAEREHVLRAAHHVAVVAGAARPPHAGWHAEHVGDHLERLAVLHGVEANGPQLAIDDDRFLDDAAAVLAKLFDIAHAEWPLQAPEAAE